MTVAISDPCSAATERTLSVPAPEEIRQVKQRLPTILSGQPDLLDNATVIARLEQKLTWSSQASNARLLLPVSIRYRGAVNAYCRLVTASGGVEDVVLVALPAQVNFDDCRAISDLRYMDINGDGMLDVVEGVLVKSNASSFQVAIPLVYRSSPAAGSGYCYPEGASRQLAPADLKSAACIRRVLEIAKNRRGIAVFSCAPSGTAH